MTPTRLLRNASVAFLAAAVTASLVLAPARPAKADVGEVRIAQQFGLSYLPLIVARHLKLIEKHAQTDGIDRLTVTWSRFGGGAAANDALLAGGVDYVSAGLGPVLTLWDKTKGRLDVKAVAALDATVVVLNTSNPKAKTIADLTDQDRIALPAVKVSHQAILLQMAAERLYGPGQHERFDPLTVTLAHPDALVALLSGRSEITGHFGNQPFIQQELAKPGIRSILTSDWLFDGPATVTSIYTTAKFRRDNPRINRAVLDALREAQDLIARDKAQVAKIYLAAEQSSLTEDFILGILEAPTTRYSLAPIKSEAFADFMFRTGMLKTKPGTWRDYYFDDIHNLDGG